MTVPRGDAILRQFGDYELLEQIGRGGMGVVYKAIQISLSRTVALKMIAAGEFASASTLQRFQIEAEAAAKLDHPNIVPIHEIGVQDGQPFFSMAFVEGSSLAVELRTGKFRTACIEKHPGKSAAREQQLVIARLLATVARAVHYAHQRGVLHRDLKPGNVLIDAEGQPHITDFGLAKLLDYDITITPSNEMLGTPSYMSPEQAGAGKATTASDVYSLGAILYELLTGRPPFVAPTVVETLRLVASEDVTDPREFNPTVDSEIATIALKCLEKDPARRYVSGAALADDLTRWIQREPILARRPTVAFRTWRWMQRNRAVTALLAGLLIGFMVTLFLSYRLFNESRAAIYANTLLKRVIDTYISEIGKPQAAVAEISSEQLTVLFGEQAPKAEKAERVSAGVFIGANQMATVLGYRQMFANLEQSLSTPDKPVRVDMKLYLSDKFALEELSAGRVTFARINAEQYLKARSHSDVSLLAIEQSENYPAVIFSRANTDITNFAGLKGRSLVFWDADSTVTTMAKALLVENGFCQRDFLTTNLTPRRESQSSYMEVPSLGYFDVQGLTVFKVLNGEYDAGVAAERQFRLVDEKTWRRLATFNIAPNVWVGSPKLKPELRERLRAALTAWRPNADHAYSDRYRAGYDVPLISTNNAALDILRKAIDARSRFDACSGNPDLPSLNSAKRTEQPGALTQGE